MKKIILCLMFVLAMCVSVEAGIEKTKYHLHRQIAKNRWVASLDTTKPENYGKCGLGIIDENDNVLLPMEYSEINDIHGESHLYEVHHNGKVGIVDDDGNFVIDAKYDYFIRGDICYGLVNGDDKVECYIIENNRTEKLHKSLPGNVAFQFEENGKFDYCVKVKTKNGVKEKHGLVNSALCVIIKPVYDNRIIIDENGYAIVYKNSKKIERATFRDFSFNKYIGGSCGVINERGIIVIPIKYRDVEHIYRGVYKCTGKGIFALSSKINLRIWGFYLVIFNVVKKIAFVVAIVLAVKHIWKKYGRKNLVSGWLHCNKIGGVHMKRIILCLVFAMSLNVKAMGEDQGLFLEITNEDITGRRGISTLEAKKISRGNDSTKEKN